MRIPEHLVEQILRQTDIVGVVGEVVQLRQRGRNFIGLCPFHGEKTPSFNVLPERGIFKCFGCGKGGNAAIFLRDYHKLNYVDALRDLAKRAGIALPEDSQESNEEANRYTLAYDALRTAGNFYYQQLLAESGSQAMAYLKKRGFSDEIIKTFGLGYSPDSYSATGAELKSLGHTEETLLDAGLSSKRDSDGKLYDRFRGRLMFPIQNSTGRVIGFGARRMNDKDTSGANAAKYVNSPQSLVYDKSKILYGIFQAKDALRRREYGILVEGYADLLSVYQAGFHNVVASSGTSLTREQVKLLSSYCKRLKIVYDADPAGIKAALRGLDLAIEENFDVEIVPLPTGDDPDSFIQREGAEAFQALLDKAQSLVHFKCEILYNEGAMDSPSGMAEAVRSVVETIAKCPDGLKRDFMVRDVAYRFSLPEQDLYRELNIFLRKRQFDRIQAAERQPSSPRTVHRDEATNAIIPVTPPWEHTNDTTPTANAISATAATPITLHAQLLPAERELLRVALTQTGAVGYLQERLRLTEEQFVTDAGKRLFTLAVKASVRNPEPLQWLLMGEELSEDEMNAVSALAVREETPSESWRKFQVEFHEDFARLLKDCISQLAIERLTREIDKLNRELKHAHDHNEGADRELALLRAIRDTDEQRRHTQAMLAGAEV
jgi:DNA primase